MKRVIQPLVVSLGIAAAVAGCNNESASPEAKIAEDALGVRPNQEGRKIEETTRKVLVEKDVKVTDQATGQVISEKKEVTPITITQEKNEKTEVKVKVGGTNPAAPVTKPQ